jgi:signal transduction histidine kinase
MPALVDEVIALHARQLKQKSIAIERRYAPTPHLFAVKGEIRQVLANLITNAIDASPAHSQIALDVRTVGRNHGADPRAIRVTVIDHGIGIPRENRRKVFEPFFTTKHSVGTGLGLWVTREIITKHHGSIRLRSCVDSHHPGTLISFSLPLSRSSAPLSASAA